MGIWNYTDKQTWPWLITLPKSLFLMKGEICPTTVTCKVSQKKIFTNFLCLHSQSVVQTPDKVQSFQLFTDFLLNKIEIRVIHISIRTNQLR